MFQEQASRVAVVRMPASQKKIERREFNVWAITDDQSEEDQAVNRTERPGTDTSVKDTEGNYGFVGEDTCGCCCSQTTHNDVQVLKHLVRLAHPLLETDRFAEQAYPVTRVGCVACQSLATRKRQ